MSNAEIALPEIKIQCNDRIRSFCINLGAFRAMEEYLTKETGNPDYSIYDDFNWYSRRVTDMVLILWAGFLTDAEDDAEPWTIKKAEKMIDFIGMIEAQDAIQKSLSRILSPEQIKAQKDRAEKKTSSKSESSLQSLQAKQSKRGRPRKQK